MGLARLLVTLSRNLAILTTGTCATRHQYPLPFVPVEQILVLRRLMRVARAPYIYAAINALPPDNRR